MNVQISKKTMYLLLIISALLDSNLGELEGSVDEVEFDDLKKNTGYIMVKLQTLFLEPLWKEHPELAPDYYLNGDFVVDTEVLGKAVEFVKKLLPE